MERYNVTGMSCAACSARVEKAVGAVKGVSSCSVSLLTNSMSVEGTADSAEIIEAVTAAGYGASVKSGSLSAGANKSADSADELKDKETPKMKKRLFWSLGFLVVLMYISMGHMMWGWYLPPFLAENHVSMGLAQMLLTGVIMVINQKFFISGFKGIIHRAPNMDTLVALGSAAAFVYGVYAVFMMSDAQLHGDADKAMTYMHELYFESAGMILTLITLGKLLEAYSKGRTTDALKGLMKLAPKTASVIRGTEGTAQKEETVPIEQVMTGDIFVVRPGESIPVDGIIIDGETAVDESALTGESIPADKIIGDEVNAATINIQGFIKCRASRVGEDTALSRIIRMVSDAAATKAPIAKIADRVSGVFVPTVIALALITAAVWLIAGEGAGFALERGISVLVISCPCALGLATPVAIMVGSGVGAKNGILFKNAASLEETGKTEIVVLDKTGTITKGQPTVTDIIPSAETDEEYLIKTALSLEQRSEHPLARAIMKYGEERGFSPDAEVSSFEALRGSGLAAVLSGEKHIAGNLRLAETYCDIPEDMRTKAESLAEQGKTPLFFCKSERLMGMIAVADIIREESAEAIAALKNMGIRTVMLTGDNERTAKAVGKLAGVDEVIAGVLPGGKEEVVRTLKSKGKTAMVGDGINDAPALTRADIGIAVGAGADIAIDAADVVLMKSRLTDVPAAIRLSRAALGNIRQNLFWAFIYNVIGMPLAAGLWIPLFGLRLSPMFGAAAMSLSSFCVVTNALRLNLVNIFSSKRDRKIKHKHKEDKNMEVTMKIEGMMCGHCEATVKKALETLPTVQSAEVSHESGTAVVKLSQPTDFEVLKKAVEDKDYKVIS